MIVLPPDTASMIKPNITISPFTHALLRSCSTQGEMSEKTERVKRRLWEHFGREFILTNSGRHALDLVMSDMGILPTDVVTIYTSLGNTYVSGCVTQVIERYCRWSMGIEPDTKAVLVIHEWGIPHPQMAEICGLGFPVIEDCAYAFASTDAGRTLGMRGRYAIFSLPKFFSVNFGGIVSGLARTEPFLPESYQDYLYNAIECELFDIENIIQKRKDNWRYLERQFATLDSRPFFDLTEGTVPGVFMFTADKSLCLDKIKATYREHGIECSVFYGTDGIYIPCNQSLSLGALEYLFAVYQGLLMEFVN